MKKNQVIIISAVLLMGLFFSIHQYIETFKTQIVAAVQTVPNPGHSWAEMESGPDSIQVTGRTITNLAAPVASTDATNKEYVDNLLRLPEGGGWRHINNGHTRAILEFTANMGRIC